MRERKFSTPCAKIKVMYKTDANMEYLYHNQAAFKYLSIDHLCHHCSLRAKKYSD
jgi:hypothetical protein